MESKPWIEHSVQVEKNSYVIKAPKKLSDAEIALAMMQHFIHHNVKKPKPGKVQVIYYHGPANP